MKVKLNDQGLVPAIAQDVNTGQVLMLGYMNPGSLKRTVEGLQVWFYSRSREDLWHKGEVSGNYLNLKEAWLDCDGDTILLKVQPDGPACHTGETSCFFTPMDGLPEGYEDADAGPGILDELFAVIRDRQRELPEGSYTTQLLNEGIGRIAQKVIEEAGETAIAAVQGNQDHLP
ncbi:MAG: bifunctional phosphoribosyl-AMP cyclohydrolase/phosphoribosyl-ATP diphosphatase HisIE, partial [Chloroflexi bacterium]|nr:bifunctional phosphoribosyl-AMP cyclohydrolase/phosphoribosyl-ATP diphosphatase HisIE [Chloroflexota bacterium]